MTNEEHNAKLRALRIEAGKLKEQERAQWDRVIALREQLEAAEAEAMALRRRHCDATNEADQMGGVRPAKPPASETPDHLKEETMLVLSRKKYERIVIGDNVTIEVRRIECNRVALAIGAPRDMRILREELQPKENAA